MEITFTKTICTDKHSHIHAYVRMYLYNLINICKMMLLLLLLCFENIKFVVDVCIQKHQHKLIPQQQFILLRWRQNKRKKTSSAIKWILQHLLNRLFNTNGFACKCDCCSLTRTARHACVCVILIFICLFMCFSLYLFGLKQHVNLKMDYFSKAYFWGLNACMYLFLHSKNVIIINPFVSHYNICEINLLMK